MKFFFSHHVLFEGFQEVAFLVGAHAGQTHHQPGLAALLNRGGRAGATHLGETNITKHSIFIYSSENVKQTLSTIWI